MEISTKQTWRGFWDPFERGRGLSRVNEVTPPRKTYACTVAYAIHGACIHGCSESSERARAVAAARGVSPFLRAAPPERRYRLRSRKAPVVRPMSGRAGSAEEGAERNVGMGGEEGCGESEEEGGSEIRGEDARRSHSVTQLSKRSEDKAL